MLVKLEKPKKLLKKQKRKFKVCQNGKKIRPFIHFIDYLSSTTYCLNIFTSLRGQTWHFVNCKGIPQQAKNRIVAESATLLSFFDFFFLFRIPRTNNITLYFSQLLQKQENLRILQKNVESAKNAESGTVCGIHKQKLIHVFRLW